MRKLGILFSFFVLVGCMPSPDKVAKCHFETQKTYPTQSVLFSARTREFMELCMNAAGYTWTMAGNNCHGGFTEADNPYINPACYQATWLYRTQSWLGKTFPQMFSKYSR